MKFLTGVLQGKWVVGAAWLEACQDLAGPVAEEGFEVQMDTAGGRGAAILGRLERAEGRRLLKGYQVGIMQLSQVSEQTLLPWSRLSRFETRCMLRLSASLP